MLGGFDAGQASEEFHRGSSDPKGEDRLMLYN